jgi:hypothetical protein
MEKLVPVFRALVPLLFAAATALGVELSDDIKSAITDNLEYVLVGIGGIAVLFPSIRAAVKFGKDAS